MAGPADGDPTPDGDDSLKALTAQVLRVPAEVVIPLRHAVLRTGRPLSEALFEADDDPRNAHFAAIDRASVNDPSAVLAVGSVLLEPPDWDISDPHAWRIRGMAARPEVRGRGLGGKVLAALLDYVRQMNGDLVWCTARVPALRLYERFGFEPRGEQSERPGIGPHQTMYTRVDRATTTP